MWPEHIFEIVGKNCGNLLAQIVEKYVEIYIKKFSPISYHKISNFSLLLHISMKFYDKFLWFFEIFEKFP